VSEPRARAPRAEEVVRGVWAWSVDDERIGAVSSGHAVAGQDGVALVDPVGLADDALAALGPVAAIVLTSGSHQRWAWRYRRELGVPLHAPALSQTLAEEPDGRYGDGDGLPGGLTAVFAPGAGTTQHALLREEAPRVLFVPDLLTNYPGQDVALVPERYMHDPAEARRSLERLLELDFDVLCLSHGEPVVDDPKGAIRAALSA
jgi:hypothetical protein